MAEAIATMAVRSNLENQSNQIKSKKKTKQKVIKEESNIERTRTPLTVG